MRPPIKNVAILLARLDSKRLPGKHFKLIGDKNLITRCCDRLKMGKTFSVVLATSTREIDDPLAEWASGSGIEVFRGDAHDIKLRIRDCVLEYGSERFARVNADSPFIDASLIDKGFEFLERTDFDLYTNLFPRTFPYGYSVEVFNTKSFINIMDQNKELENISTFFYQHPDRFKIENLALEGKNYSDITLTMDTQEDLERIREFYRLDERLFELSLEEIVKLNQKIKIN